MSNEIKAAVTAILDQASVTFIAIYKGKNAKARDLPMDEWATHFTRQKSDGTHHAQQFEYFTGLGHRKPNDSPMAKESAQSLAKVSKRMLAWEHHYKRYPDQVVAPHAAGVLYSLLSDANACEESFESWCDSYGYDSDSRKALATYQACQENGDKLRRVFNGATISALRDALQDY
jgi:hypothetical protein